MPESKTIVVSITSPGISKGAGGFVIINGKLKRVPPNSPKLKELAAALNLMSSAEEIADKKIRSQLNGISDSLLTANIGELVEEVSR